MIATKRCTTAAIVGGACLVLPLMLHAAPLPQSATYPLVTVSVDRTELTTRGILMNGRTLLPVRELVERLDGKVMWDSYSKTVWAAFPAQERTIRMTVNSPVTEIYAYAGNDPHRTGRLIESTRLEQPPVLLGGRVVAPVAAAAEVAGAKLFFDTQTKHAYIETAASRQAANP